jgi:RNA polymerase sigma-70 factor (ECF subfamily)
MSETDKYYIDRCLDGHPDDFRFLVRRYQKALLAYLAGRLYSLEKAEEASQEALVRAYFNIEKLKKPDSFFSWLLGIANRVVLEMNRKENVQRGRKFVEAVSETTSDPEFSTDYRLEAAIAELPEAYRQIVLLRYYGDHSCKEISEQFGIPLGTVTKQLSRAYVMLRNTLEQHNSNGEVQK